MAGNDDLGRVAMDVDDILLEFQRFGHVVKVTAVDARTGTEVCLQAPAGLSQIEMERAAAAKLAYVMNRRAP
ncbi:MAG: DUF6898 family protein [Inquilinaceae bacterium]